MIQINGDVFDEVVVTDAKNNLLVSISGDGVVYNEHFQVLWGMKHGDLIYRVDEKRGRVRVVKKETAELAKAG